MIILVYDTETTGLPVWDEPSEDPCQPRITQLCAELVDDDTREVLASINTLIKPNGWTIPEELEKLTGITTKKCEHYGMPAASVLDVFFEMWECSDLRVGHNESFDMRMVRIEIFRNADYDEKFCAAFADQWKAGKAFCTQGKSSPILKLPPTERMIASGRRGNKSPNLGEAYKHFTGKELVNAHNAGIDVMACKAVYFGIRAAEKLAA